MNKFDKAVNKKTSELITKNMLGKDVSVIDYKKFKVIARAMIREEWRGVKPNRRQDSLYNKTWKAAGDHEDIEK